MDFINHKYSKALNHLTSGNFTCDQEVNILMAIIKLRINKKDEIEYHQQEYFRCLTELAIPALVKRDLHNKCDLNIMKDAYQGIVNSFSTFISFIEEDLEFRKYTLTTDESLLSIKNTRDKYQSRINDIDKWLKE